MFRIFSDPKMLFAVKKFLCAKNRSHLLDRGGGVLLTYVTIQLKMLRPAQIGGRESKLRFPFTVSFLVITSNIY